VLAEAGYRLPRPRPAFGHGVEVSLEGTSGPLTLLGSYHVSQQNTFTGRPPSRPVVTATPSASGVSRDTVSSHQRCARTGRRGPNTGRTRPRTPARMRPTGSWRLRVTRVTVRAAAGRPAARTASVRRAPP
jgi:hypothetical protein